MPRQQQQKKSPPKVSSPPKSPSTPLKPEKKGPGLLGQAASMTTGAAVGSSIGHAVGHTLTKPTTGGVKCDLEWKSFVDCSQKSSDQTNCQETLKAFKECLKSWNKAD